MPEHTARYTRTIPYRAELDTLVQYKITTLDQNTFNWREIPLDLEF